MNKISVITVLLLCSLCLFSCGNNGTKATVDKEKELLEKELELAKRELEISKKESETQTNADSQTKKHEKAEVVEKSKSSTIDILDDPIKIMQTIFDAAKTRDFSKLSWLCDPTGNNDRDTRNICNMEFLPLEVQDEFVEYFKNGKIIGNATIIGSNASVKFKVGSNGDKDEEMVFVKIDGKWYLEGF